MQGKIEKARRIAGRTDSKPGPGTLQKTGLGEGRAGGQAVNLWALVYPRHRSAFLATFALLQFDFLRAFSNH